MKDKVELGSPGVTMFTFILRPPNKVHHGNIIKTAASKKTCFPTSPQKKTHTHTHTFFNVFFLRQDRRSSVPDILVDLSESERPAKNGPSRPAWPLPSGPPEPLSLGLDWFLWIDDPSLRHKLQDFGLVTKEPQDQDYRDLFVCLFVCLLVCFVFKFVRYEVWRVNLSLSQSLKTEVLIEHDLIFEEAICQMDPLRFQPASCFWS